MLLNTRKLKDLRGQRFPKTLTAWLGDDVFGGFLDLQGGTYVKNNVVLPGASHDLSVMRFWPRTSKDPEAISALEVLTDSVGNRAIKSADAMNNMLSDAENTNRLLQAWLGARKVASPNAHPLQLRVGTDANASVVSALSPKGYGAPTVMITTPLGFRQVGDDRRFPGIGTMIMGHVGQSLLVTWGMQRAVEVGPGLCDEVAFFEGMSGGRPGST